MNTRACSPLFPIIKFSGDVTHELQQLNW